MEFLKKLKESLDEGKVFNSEDIDKINQITELSKKYDNKIQDEMNGADFQNSLDFNKKSRYYVKNNAILDKIKVIMDYDNDLMELLKKIEGFLNNLNDDEEIKYIPDYEHVKDILEEFNKKYNFRKNGNINIKLK